MALTQGTRLGSYEIVAPRRADGRDEVYQTRDTRVDWAPAITIGVVAARDQGR